MLSAASGCYHRRCKESSTMDHTCCHRQSTARSRREFLTTSGFGFGGLALGYLLNREHALGNVGVSATVNPLAARTPHFPAKARSVICLFMKGGPSQMDSFDPKPLLSRLDGQPIPTQLRHQGPGPAVRQGRGHEADGVPADLPQIWAVRPGDLGPFQPPGSTRRRSGRDPLLLPRLLYPWAGPP